MVGLMLLASKKSVMGSFTSGLKTTWFGWGGAVVMGVAVLMMFQDLARQLF
jgi:Mn2+/Fe2+ NRAMP family transporter